MEDIINTDYYYGIKDEQFSFFRIPRSLITDRRFRSLSNDAKLLYGLMLDRMSISRKNHWLDELDRVYIIYSVNDIMRDIGCSSGKCSKILAELDTKKGMGLIERHKRGLGRSDIIYVKNLTIQNEAVCDFQTGNDEPDGMPETVRQEETVQNIQSPLDLQRL